MSSNRKLGVPNSNPGQGLAMSGGHIISGRIPCLFGPGQTPAAEYYGVAEGDDYPLPLTRPDRWPSPGCVLRHPQVVRMAVAVNWGELFQNYSMMTPFAGVGLSGRPTDSAYFQITRFNYLIPSDWRYSQNAGSFTSPYIKIRKDLKDVFEGAKARIEALRPNRTFVDIVDWNGEGDQSDSPSVVAENRSKSPYFTGLVKWSEAPPAAPIEPWPVVSSDQPVTESLEFPHFGLPWVAFRPGSAGDFFGTDFLHIYCGHPGGRHLVSNGKDGVDADRLVRNQGFQDIATMERDFFATPDSPFTAAQFLSEIGQRVNYDMQVSNLRNSIGKFRGYRTMFYSFPPGQWKLPAFNPEIISRDRVEWTQEYIGIFGPDTTPGPAKDPANDDYTWIGKRDIGPELGSPDPFYANQVRQGHPSLLNIVNGKNKLALAWDSVVKYHQEFDSRAADVYREFISQNDDDGDLGFSYEGDTGGLDEDSLVALIAEHYGFSPDTGVDIG